METNFPKLSTILLKGKSCSFTVNQDNHHFGIEPFRQTRLICNKFAYCASVDICTKWLTTAWMRRCFSKIKIVVDEEEKLENLKKAIEKIAADDGNGEEASKLINDIKVDERR